MQVKAKYTSVLVQYDVRRSQHKQKDERTTQRSTKQTKQNKNQQQTTPTGQNKTSQNTGQQGGQTRPNKTRVQGGESKRRPANKERADAREGSRDRRERAAQAKKAGTCSFIGVLRVFWITQGRIPQCQSEGHMNSTHHMV